MTQTAIFAAGCFWGVESNFRKINGVIDTEVGYTGGHEPNPSYERVCSGETGHAEAIKVTYDPATVCYSELLNYFWGMHDPTTPNRQGPDIGTQYRSAVFYLTDEQKDIAEQSKEAREKLIASSIVTEITKASEFYRAEEYHQRYHDKLGF